MRFVKERKKEKNKLLHSLTRSFYLLLLMTSMKYVVANMLVFDTFIISMCVVPTNTFESISIVSLSNNRVGRSPLT